MAKNFVTRTKMEEWATKMGLYVAHYSPGDGKTRYKVFREPTDYFAGDAFFFCFGLKDLYNFLFGYASCLEHVRKIHAEEAAHEMGG